MACTSANSPSANAVEYASKWAICKGRRMICDSLGVSGVRDIVLESLAEENHLEGHKNSDHLLFRPLMRRTTACNSGHHIHCGQCRFTYTYRAYDLIDRSFMLSVHICERARETRSNVDQSRSNQKQ